MVDILVLRTQNSVEVMRTFVLSFWVTVTPEDRSDDMSVYNSHGDLLYQQTPNTEPENLVLCSLSCLELLMELT